MMNAPSGTNIPLVIQIGKWRRKIILPTVTKCGNNAFTDAATMRLPRSMNDRAPGDAPGTCTCRASRCRPGTPTRSTVCCASSASPTASSPTTAAAAASTCTSAAPTAAAWAPIRLMSGATFANAYSTLFANYNKMLGYDIVILQCEGSQLESAKMPYLGNMKRYADNGGRIFADHLHSVWIRQGLPPWPATATVDRRGRRPADADHRHRRHVVPQGRGAGRLAGRQQRVDDARPDPAASTASTRSTPCRRPARRWIYTDQPGDHAST